MLLNLTTNKDVEKFYKRIWLYKSLLFYKTNFVYDVDIDLQTKYIIDSLNIKKRKDRITFVYDKTCELIDNKNKGINICGFNGRVCKAHQCLKSKNYLDGCCRMCLYKTPKGCPSKNIACKLFNCSAVKEKYEVYEYKDLKILKVLSIKNRIIVKHDYFSLREDVLKDLYSYSIICSTMKMVIRILKNLLKVKKIK